MNRKPDSERRAGDVLMEIRRCLPQLSDGQSRLARFILADPQACKAISLQALCGRCGTSGPVVFALCRALGFGSFRDLKLALAEDLGAARARLDLDPPHPGPVDANLRTVNSPGRILRTLGQAYRQSIEETVKSVDPRQFEKVVDAMDRASRMVILGVGVSGNVGLVVLQNFLRSGKPVTWTTDPNLFVTHLAPLAPGDVCLALAQIGNYRDTVEGMAFAKSRRLFVAVITSDPASDAAREADAALVTAPQPVSSATHLSIGAHLAAPLLLVADALAVALGARSKQAFDERALATAKTIKKRNSSVR